MVNCCENCKHYIEDKDVFDCEVKGTSEVAITEWSCDDWEAYD